MKPNGHCWAGQYNVHNKNPHKSINETHKHTQLKVNTSELSIIIVQQLHHLVGFVVCRVTHTNNLSKE